jgi:anthraniloyl-CoA monooxygenase
MEFERELSEADLEELAATSDLLVAADGVNSTIRRMHERDFGTTLDPRGTKFVWFGTDFAFKAFTFVFRENRDGLFQVHAYPFDAASSTFIVECPEEVWRRAGLDRATEEESIAYCEKLFAEDLRGHSLLSNRSIWFSFVTVRNDSWHRGNVVLLGDAAHTAHFTIGSGTKLAMEDAISLGGALERHGGAPDRLEAALTDYELERQPMVERFQEAARESQLYFESVSRYAAFEPIQFAFNLLTRSGRIGHTNLSLRDPRFVARLDAWFADRAVTSLDQTSGPARLRVAPPPLFAPIGLGNVVLANRAVVAPPGEDTATDGMPAERHTDQLREAVGSGAGLVLTEMLAVTPEGRITPGSAGLYTLDHARAWERLLERVRGEAGSGVRVAARIGHAGRRGSTRPRREGADRPLRAGNWPLMSASAVPFAPWSRYPREMLREDMDRVREAFARSARWAAEAGFDLVELDMAHGYLLASFLSPLSNERRDEHGGELEARMRFPLEVLDAVRAELPGDRPLAVRLTATDWARGGLTVDDAVQTARAFAEHGCDLVHVMAGGTVPEARPEYRRFYLVPASDRIRNEAGIPTLVGGHLTTADEVNTILAAGRADLCLIDLPAEPS